MTINLTNKTIQHAEIKEEPDKADSTATKKQKLDDDEEVLDQMLHLLQDEPVQQSDKMKTD